MAATTRDVTAAAGVWTRIATNPTAITIKSNRTTGASRWRLAWTAAGAPAASLIGEVHKGGESYPAQSVTGEVYVNPDEATRFAVTQDGGTEG